MTVRSPAMPILVACAALAVGCGRGGTRTVPVSGSVTFAGKPVASGEIVLRDPEGRLASAAARIADGQYRMRAPVGPKRVEIIATRPAAAAARPRPGGEEPPVEMYVPERYNALSTLTADVTAAGPNQFDFALAPEESAAVPR